MSSIYGYAYEIMYLDNEAKPRFKAINPSEMIVCYDNTLEENIALAIRYYDEKVKINDDFKKILFLKCCSTFTFIFYYFLLGMSICSKLMWHNQMNF